MIVDFLRLSRGVLLLALIPAWAHDLYFMPATFTPQPGEDLGVVFQNGDEFPEASSPVQPHRLRETKLLQKGGSAEFQGVTAEASRTTATVRVPGPGLGILTARTIPNLLELEAAKFESYLEHENLTGTIRWRKEHGESNKPGRERYSKYVKSLIRAGKSDDFYRHRTGLTIEIVPEADPYGLQPGATLPVQVLFRGAPAADVAVESAWVAGGKTEVYTIGRTDREGRIQIPVKGTGPHRLHAIVMERCHDPAADWESFWASLTFEIPR